MLLTVLFRFIPFPLAALPLPPLCEVYPPLAWMAATARGAASPSPASPSLPRRDSAVIRLFQAKLRANATDRVSKRLTSLEQLSIITNSKEFREATNECGEELSTRLSSMMDESNNISLSMSDISYVKRLGEGGFAYCDLYERKLLNGKSMFYALKVLKEELHIPSVDPLSNPARVAYLPESEKIKFISEALVLTSLRHKHLVGCYGCLREEKKEGKGLPAPKLLLEYCPGGTLLDQLQQRKYLVDDAFRWLLQISMGMSYLHATGCIHRDLKPENVLLKNGEAKVADFGLFRMKLSSSAIHNPHQPQVGSSLTARPHQTLPPTHPTIFLARNSQPPLATCGGSLHNPPVHAPYPPPPQAPSLPLNHQPPVHLEPQHDLLPTHSPLTCLSALLRAVDGSGSNRAPQILDRLEQQERETPGPKLLGQGARRQVPLDGHELPNVE